MTLTTKQIGVQSIEIHDTALIRREPKARNGYNNGDLDVCFQLFANGMVWDGNIVSKSSRDHLVWNGYAVKREGMQALTGKGTIAFLLNRHVWASAWRRRRLWKRNPFIASHDQIKRGLE